jgi:hypothetical protein
MLFSEKHHKKLKKAFISTYGEKEKVEVGDQWQTETMRRIRQIRPQESSATYLLNFERLVWRFAPVSCALILVFSICLLNLDFAQEYEMSKLLLDDPVEYAVVQSFGI